MVTSASEPRFSHERHGTVEAASTTMGWGYINGACSDNRVKYLCPYVALAGFYLPGEPCLPIRRKFSVIIIRTRGAFDPAHMSS